MKEWIKCGQAVVCVRDDWDRRVVNLMRHPAKGEVCTIDGYGLRPEILGKLFVHLAGFGGAYFTAEYFRPVRPTSIGKLTELLTVRPTQKHLIEKFDELKDHEEAHGLLQRKVAV